MFLKGCAVCAGDDVYQLLGTGERIKDVESVEFHSWLSTLRQDFNDDMWDDQQGVCDVSFSTYKYADIRAETVHSKAYEAAVSKVSYFVQVRFLEGAGDEETKYVAKLLQFVKATPTVTEGFEEVLPQRFAVCNLYRTTVVNKYYGKALIVSSADARNPKWERHPLPLRLVDCKLVFCNPTVCQSIAQQNHLFFVPYPHRFRSVDAGQ